MSSTPVFNKRKSTYRREVVLSLLSGLTGLEKEHIEDKILTLIPGECRLITTFKTDHPKVSYDMISYMVEKKTWTTLLKEHGLSTQDYPWIFTHPTVPYQEGMEECETYSIIRAQERQASGDTRGKGKAVQAQPSQSEPTSQVSATVPIGAKEAQVTENLHSVALEGPPAAKRVCRTLRETNREPSVRPDQLNQAISQVRPKNNSSANKLKRNFAAHSAEEAILLRISAPALVQVLEPEPTGNQETARRPSGRETLHASQSAGSEGIGHNSLPTLQDAPRRSSDIMDISLSTAQESSEPAMGIEPPEPSDENQDYDSLDLFDNDI